MDSSETANARAKRNKIMTHKSSFKEILITDENWNPNSENWFNSANARAKRKEIMAKKRSTKAIVVTDENCSPSTKLTREDGSLYINVQRTPLTPLLSGDVEQNRVAVSALNTPAMRKEIMSHKYTMKTRVVPDKSCNPSLDLTREDSSPYFNAHRTPLTPLSFDMFSPF